MERITMPRGDIKNIHFTVCDANDTDVSKEFTQITFTVKANTSSRKIIMLADDDYLTVKMDSVTVIGTDGTDDYNKVKGVA